MPPAQDAAMRTQPLAQTRAVPARHESRKRECRRTHSLDVSFLKRSTPACPVVHVMQRRSWDCGLACSLMALRGAGYCPDFAFPALPDLEAAVGTSSVWTIDLAFLLRDQGVRPRMFTVTVGVDPSYDRLPFYATLPHDHDRVSARFRDAAALGVSVEKRSLSWQELRDLIVDDDCLVIVLVDARRLPTWSCLSSLVHGGSSFIGHYILLCGFFRGEFVYHDPAHAARDGEVRTISVAALDEARRSFGTDEDVIAVPPCVLPRFPSAHDRLVPDLSCGRTASPDSCTMSVCSGHSADEDSGTDCDESGAWLAPKPGTEDVEVVEVESVRRHR